LAASVSSVVLNSLPLPFRWGDTLGYYFTLNISALPGRAAQNFSFSLGILRIAMVLVLILLFINSEKMTDVMCLQFYLKVQHTTEIIL